MTQAANQPAALADEWFTPGRFVVLLAVALFAAFPEVILGSHTFYYRDFGHFAYPLAQYHRDCFWRGEVPLWNPYNSCGLPHLAQWNTMCLYPGTLLYLLGPMPWAVGGFSLAHLLLAGAGAYRLAHHWTGSRFAACIGGLAFAFNGFTLHAVMWPNNVAALAWAPWLWLLVARLSKVEFREPSPNSRHRNAELLGGRTLLLAALVGAMQMLAGAPEVILFTWVVAVPLALVGTISNSQFSIANLKFPLLRLTTVALLVALLSAAQLLPFLDLLRNSHRTAGFDDNLYAMPLWGWANFFVPLFRMTPDRLGVFTQLDQQWTSSYYPGLGVLALAALAVWRRREPRVWLLAAVAVLGVWLAMGKNAFLLDWLKTICPPLGFIRFPIKYVLLPLMVLPFLAAMGCKAGNAGSEAGGRGSSRVVTVLVLLVGGLILCQEPEVEAASPLRRFLNGGWRAVGLLGLIGVILEILRSTLPSHRRTILFLGLLAAFAFDILTHAPRQNPTVITQAYEPGVAKFSTTMPRLGEGRAMVSRDMEGFMAHAQNPDALNYCIGARRAAFANWNLLDGVPKANGMFSQFPRELSDTWWLLYGTDRPFPERFADFLGITRISSSEVLFTWAHRTNALPLVTSGQQPIFANATNTLRALASPEFDPTKVVYLPDSLRPLATVTNAASARVLSTRWTAQELRLEVEADAPAWLVIAQTYYHPWKAFVGERELPLHRANHAFQALEISAGLQQVTLRYVDHAFTLGVCLSLATLSAVLFALACCRRTDH